MNAKDKKLIAISLDGNIDVAIYGKNLNIMNCVNTEHPVNIQIPLSELVQTKKDELTYKIKCHKYIDNDIQNMAGWLKELDNLLKDYKKNNLSINSDYAISNEITKTCAQIINTCTFNIEDHKNDFLTRYKVK